MSKQVQKEQKVYDEQLKTGNHQLEGDGIIESIYHLLWTKDPVFGTMPSLLIPDTVIFKYDEPQIWYFMSEGSLKKKNKSKLNIDHIGEIFLKKAPPSGIIAYILYPKIQNNDDQSTNINNLNTTTVFEYFDQERFIEFLKKKPKPAKCILQRFIQPKGEYNFQLKAIWGPKLCFFEKKECNKKINEKKYDIYERVFTYEAEDFHSRTVPVRGYVLPNKLEKLCFNIAQHITNVSFEYIKIKRAVFHFKIDDSDKLWFLYCSSVRLYHDNDNHLTTLSKHEKIPLETHVISTVPDKINTENFSLNKPIRFFKEFKCYKCLNFVDVQQIYEITFELVVKAYENDYLRSLNQQQGGSIPLQPRIQLNPQKTSVLNSLVSQPKKGRNVDKHNLRIPLIIKNVYPNIKEKEYHNLKQSPGFLKQAISVCENCYLQVIQSVDFGAAISSTTVQLINQEFIGTGRLRPEFIRLRQNLTMRELNSNDQDNIISGKTQLQKMPPYDTLRKLIFTPDNYQQSEKTSLSDNESQEYKLAQPPPIKLNIPQESNLNVSMKINIPTFIVKTTHSTQAKTDISTSKTLTPNLETPISSDIQRNLGQRQHNKNEKIKDEGLSWYQSKQALRGRQYSVGDIMAPGNRQKSVRELQLISLQKNDLLKEHSNDLQIIGQDVHSQSSSNKQTELKIMEELNMKSATKLFPKLKFLNSEFGNLQSIKMQGTLSHRNSISRGFVYTQTPGFKINRGFILKNV